MAFRCNKTTVSPSFTQLPHCPSQRRLQLLHVPMYVAHASRPPRSFNCNFSFAWRRLTRASSPAYALTRASSPAYALTRASSPAYATVTRRRLLQCVRRTGASFVIAWRQPGTCSRLQRANATQQNRDLLFDYNVKRAETTPKVTCGRLCSGSARQTGRSRWPASSCRTPALVQHCCQHPSRLLLETLRRPSPHMPRCSHPKRQHPTADLQPE